MNNFSLLLQGVDESVEDDAVRAAAAGQKGLKNVRVIRDHASGTCKGFGFLVRSWYLH